MTRYVLEFQRDGVHLHRYTLFPTVVPDAGRSQLQGRAEPHTLTDAMDTPLAPLRAAIDIGTNTILLLVARTDGTSLTPVEDHATITRLGAGVDRTGSLSSEAIARALDCLRGYAQRLRTLGVTQLRVVATSAVRDAANRGDFVVPAEAILGARVETIEGDREALLTFRGSTVGLPLAPEARVLTFDIGGGSTEVIVGRVGHAPSLARSLDVGVVRLTERMVHHDPPTVAERGEIRDVTARALASLGAVPAFDVLVGIAGTVTTLAAIHHGVVPYDAARIHGARLSVTAAREVCDRLAAMDVATRSTIPGLDPRRADVIVAGGEILQAILGWTSATEVMVSDGGVRVGLLLAEPTA